jgi:protein-S-isoprenylcysteine O-methyltransferase Ste14
MRFLLRVLGFLLTLGVWHSVNVRSWDPEVSFIIIVGGPLLVLPVARLGRLMLDARATVERAAWVAAPIHYAVMIPLGAALIEAFKRGQVSPGWRIPLPAELGGALMSATGLVVLMTVVNLALRGLGAPFAIALSRRLASDWMYAWTRNPMVLSLLAFLLSTGLWLRSLWFILWVLALPTPVMLAFLKWFEERELEIRFGQSYRDYSARTPMLWPRRPRA